MSDREKVRELIEKVDAATFDQLPGPTAIRVMFLGGTLDHTVRLVARDEINPERPASNLVKAPIYTAQWRRLGPRDVAETPVQEYDLHKVESGHRSWWCFVLRGYAPPHRHLLDANPHPI